LICSRQSRRTCRPERCRPGSQLAERIIDHVADAVIYASRSGVIVRWNRASAALFGFSAEDTLGQSLDLIIPEHLRASHWRGFEAAMTKAQ
jgi:PAS domain S-box-containing protein